MVVGAQNGPRKMTDHLRIAAVTLAMIVLVLAVTKDCTFVRDPTNPYGMNKEYWKRQNLPPSR